MHDRVPPEASEGSLSKDPKGPGRRGADPLRLFLDTVLDAVVVMRSDGTVLEWNDRATELFGWPAKEVLGRSMAEVIIPERYRVAHVEGLKNFLSTGQGPVIGRRIEISALRKNGVEFPVELSITPISGKEGLVFVGCLRDISDRKRVQETLSEREMHFELLVQGVKDYAIYMLDTAGRVTNWNSGAQRITGYDREEIIGEHFSRFYAGEDLENGLPDRALQQALQEGKVEIEGWRTRKDGSRFWASALINPIHDQKRTHIGFANIIRDETERRAAQQILNETRERMLEMQKMEAVGQLTGGIAHDFNNLLMIIIGNLETAQRQAGVLEKALAGRLSRVIDNAIAGAQRAAALTQRLLAFSRRQPLNPKALAVNKFITGSVEFLQRSLGETIQIEAVGGGGVWPIEVDNHQLEAALLNLAVNARDAMPQGGKLTIEAGNVFLDHHYCRAHPEIVPGQYVLISVSDNGAGMTKEIAARAFEPFFTTKAVGQGTGLGLSQVYGFVKQSGGHIKIYSEVDQGTSVKLYFPRFSAGAVIEEPPERQQASAEGQNEETILVVEDDHDVRAYLLEALRDLNYNAVGAEDSASALALIDRRDIRIDLLLTDVILPGINGKELANRAKSIRPALKIVFMTGYSRNAIVHHGRLDAGVELIQKPITQAELAARLRHVLDVGR